MSSLFLGTVGAAIPIAAGAAYFGSRYAGENDIFGTFIPGGAGKVIVRGETPVKFYINSPGRFINDPESGYYIDDVDRKGKRLVPDWEIIDEVAYRKVRHEDIPNDLHFLTQQFGLYPIWRWPFDMVMKYKFSWTEWVQPEGKLDYEPCSREEETEIFMVKAFPYFSRIRDIFIQGNLQFDVDYLANLRITNPKKALFDNEDWLATALAALDESAKDWIAAQNLESLLSQTDAVKVPGLSESLNKELMKCNKAFLIPVVGCELTKANFLKLVDKNEAAGNLRNAIQAVFVARQNAEALKLSSEADAAAKRAVGTAEAEVRKLMEEAAVAGEKAFAEAYKDNPQLAAARAFQQTKITTYVQGGSAPSIFINPQPPNQNT